MICLNFLFMCFLSRLCAYSFVWMLCLVLKTSYLCASCHVYVHIFWMLAMLDLSFLYLAWATFLGMAMSDLHFSHTLLGPYPWDVGNDWFIFSLCVSCIVHVCVCVSIYIYIYIYIFAYLKMIMHFVWWTHMVRRVPPHCNGCSWPWSVGMHSRQLL